MNRDINTYSDIVLLVKTTAEAQHVLLEIDTLITHLYMTESGTPEEILTKHVSNELAVPLLRSMKTNGISWQDQKQTKDYFLGLKAAIAQLKILKLTIAFKPNSHTVAVLSARLRADLGQHILLDFTYDPTIMGGAVLAFGGTYRNFTLKKRIAEVFEKQREKIWPTIT